MRNARFLLGTLLIVLSSCQGFIEDEIWLAEKDMALTRSINSWDACTMGILRSGEPIVLPWANSTNSTIPDDIRTDVKEIDGWRLLYTNLGFLDYTVEVSTADEGVNYILLYNIYSGMLKGFYYAKTMDPNNHAYWLLTTDSKTKLFNFVPYFAKPADYDDTPQCVSLSTITRNNITSGFEAGWNCFMLELAYDDNSMNQKLSLLGYSLNESTITFSGAYQSSSSGTIVSSTQNKSNSIDGLASIFGKTGKEWVKNNTGGTKAIKYIGEIGQVVEKGISGFISSGLYKIFGSVLGKAQTTQDLQFSTNGKIKIEGKSVTPVSGLIKSVSGIPLNSLNQDLGVWNLETTPIYTATAYSELQKIEYGISGGRAYSYKLNFTPSMVFKKNPAIKTNVTSTIETVRYDLFDGTRPDFYNQYPSGNPEFAYRANSLTTLYSDEMTVIKDVTGSYNVYVNNVLPNKTSPNNIPAIDFTIPQINIRENIVFKVLATVYSPQGKVYSSKSFIPIHKFSNIQSARPYSWTYEELKKKGY